MLHILLLLLLALPSSSLGENSITLSSVTDFTGFVNEVNSGSNYSGTTVYLGTDITLSESIDPIGINSTYQFLGVFDGQGHIISSLTIESSLTHVGLFGYSNRLTTKNVVLDDSCSITNTFTGTTNVNVGGIIGWCYAGDERCNIENSVNMASVTFNGNTTGSAGLLHIGGIVGQLASSSYNVHVKNCVNYGSVTDSGTVSEWIELGGIVGESHSWKSPSYNCYIQNCLNYGTITHRGTSGYLYIGGIAGYSHGTYIENCVSAGKKSSQTVASGDNCIGSIVGYIDSSFTYINYCYYTSDVNVGKLYGTGTPSSTTETPTSPTDVDSDLVSKLNSNATSCNWDNWFMLHLNGGSINNLTQELLVEIQGHIPDPAKEGNSFLFWCKVAECTEEFEPDSEPVSGITDLYAAWIPNNYTVTFDFNNGTTVNETFAYNTEIAYPENSSMVKEGYTFSQWSNYCELMPARDITVTAQWTPNNYTVTFDANGGNASETTKTVTFNEKYGELPEPRRTGYAFFGWFTSEINGTEVTNETIVTVPHNHTLYAHWEEVTNQVEIVFSTKDLTQEEVEKLIEQYTNADFEITQFENESGEIRVIIGFTDKEDAERFVRNVKGSSNAMNVVKRIDLVTDDRGSFSTTIYPLSFLSALFL